MRDRATALAVALALAGAMAACGGGAEKNVVSQYFGALKAGDTGTLTSFAMVAVRQDGATDFSIIGRRPRSTVGRAAAGAGEEAEGPRGRAGQEQPRGPDLGQRPQHLPQARRSALAREKGGKIPAALEPIRQKWNAFNEKDRELKKAVAEAKGAVEREQRNVTLSVGASDDLDTMTGEMITKDIDLELTINGETKPYVMTLRKYELTGGSGPRMVARWVVQSLTPKA